MVLDEHGDGDCVIYLATYNVNAFYLIDNSIYFVRVLSLILYIVYNLCTETSHPHSYVEQQIVIDCCTANATTSCMNHIQSTPPRHCRIISHI